MRHKQESGEALGNQAKEAQHARAHARMLSNRPVLFSPEYKPAQRHFASPERGKRQNQQTARCSRISSGVVCGVKGGNAVLMPTIIQRSRSV